MSKLSQKIDATIEESPEITAAKQAAREHNLKMLKSDLRTFVGNAHTSCVAVFVNEVTEDSVLLGSASATVPVAERKTLSVDRAMFPEAAKKQRWEICIERVDLSGSRKYLVGDIVPLRRITGYDASSLLED